VCIVYKTRLSSTTTYKTFSTLMEFSVNQGSHTTNLLENMIIRLLLGFYIDSKYLK